MTREKINISPQKSRFRNIGRWRMKLYNLVARLPGIAIQVRTPNNPGIHHRGFFYCLA
jgi:hypothetical protein